MLSVVRGHAFGFEKPVLSPAQRMRTNSATSVKFQAKTYNPLLMTACRQGDHHQIEQLLAKGANPNMVNVLGETPMNAAITQRDLESARLLIKHGADPHRNDEFCLAYKPLGRAIINNALPIGEMLLNQGVSHEAADCNGLTPLMLAIWWGRSEFARLLLKRGAKVKAPERKEQPLKQAAMRDSPQLTQCILEQAKKENMDIAAVVEQVMDDKKGFPRTLPEAESLALLWRDIQRPNGRWHLGKTDSSARQKQLTEFNRQFQNRYQDLLWNHLKKTPVPLPTLVFNRELGVKSPFKNPLNRHS